MKERILKILKGKGKSLTVFELEEELKKDYFNTHYKNVCLIKDYKQALDKLEKENNKYDLVVFDINMNEGIEKIEFKSIREVLKKKRVLVQEEKYDEFIKIAGI